MRWKKLLRHSDAGCIQLSTKTLPHPSAVHAILTTSTPLRLQDRHRSYKQEGHNLNSQVSSAIQQNHHYSITLWPGQEQVLPSTQSLLTNIN